MTDDPSEYDWGLLVPSLVHPIKVAIIEALFFMDQELSASDLRRLFESEDLQLPQISYHVEALEKAGALVNTRGRQVRGAYEKFYVLREP